MISSIFQRPVVKLMIVSLLISTVCVIIFTPDNWYLKWISNQANSVMLIFLLVAILFLIANHYQLMFAGFVCCASLAIYLKSSSDARLSYPQMTSDPSLALAHVNLANLGPDSERGILALLGSSADVIVAAEMTPNWSAVLPERLEFKYPNQIVLTRIDPFGIAVFSRLGIKSVDTIIYNGDPGHIDIPYFHLVLQLNDRDSVILTSSQFTPPVNQAGYRSIHDHLHQMIGLNGLDHPRIISGDFNLPSWAAEVQNFKARTFMRECVKTTSPFRQQMEHIFYSEHFDCVLFRDLEDSDYNHIGVMGILQLRNSYVKKVGE